MENFIQRFTLERTRAISQEQVYQAHALLRPEMKPLERTHPLTPEQVAMIHEMLFR